MVNDEVEEEVKPGSTTSEPEPKDPPPPFYWMQGMEDIVIWVELPPNTNKREIKVSMPRPSELRVSIKVKIHNLALLIWHFPHQPSSGREFESDIEVEEKRLVNFN